MSFPLIPDIIFTIGLHIDREDLSVFFRLSTHFNTISKRDFFWYQRILMDFPQHSQDKIDRIVMTGWRGYRHIYDAFLIVKKDPDASSTWCSNVKIATRNADIPMLKMLAETSLNGLVYTIVMFITAAKYGHLNILDFVGKREFWLNDAISKAALYGQLDVIKWASAKSNFHPKNATDIINVKTRRNHTRIIEWLLEEYPSERKEIISAVFVRASYRNNEEIMDWCRQKGYPVS